MFTFLAKTLAVALYPQALSRIRGARALRGAPQGRVERPNFGQSDRAGVRARQYADYDHYLSHQANKYAVVLEKCGGFDRRTLVVYRIKFWLRFRRVARLLAKDSLIVCAGARDGTEVEVWRDLGFRNAIGYDLNPGSDNPLVKQGDFNRLPLGDGTVDAIYSNCIDHAFELHAMFAEAKRVLKPGGLFVYDVSIGSGGTFEALEWKRPEIALIALLEFADELIEVRRWRAWMQVTARKSN